MKQWSPAAWLGTSAARSRIVDVFRAARPLCEWLDEPLDHATTDHGDDRGASTMAAAARP